MGSATDRRRLLPRFARTHLRPWVLHLQGRQIAERHDPDEALIRAHHREAPDPPMPHLLRYILDALALETVQRVRGHRLAHGNLFRIAAFDHHSESDVAFGNPSYQFLAFTTLQR